MEAKFETRVPGDAVPSTEGRSERRDFGAHEAVHLVVGIGPGVGVEGVIADCTFSVIRRVRAKPAPIITNCVPPRGKVIVSITMSWERNMVCLPEVNRFVIATMRCTPMRMITHLKS